MGRLIKFTDRNGYCWARVDLDNGDELFINVPVDRSQINLNGRLSIKRAGDGMLQKMFGETLLQTRNEGEYQRLLNNLMVFLMGVRRYESIEAGGFAGTLQMNAVLNEQLAGVLPEDMRTRPLQLLTAFAMVCSGASQVRDLGGVAANFKLEDWVAFLTGEKPEWLSDEEETG